MPAQGLQQGLGLRLLHPYRHHPRDHRGRRDLPGAGCPHADVRLQRQHPATEYADYKFFSFAEDDVLCEAIYTYQITLVARFLKNAGAFPKYDTFMEEFGNIAPYLIKAKDAQDDAAPPWPRTSRTPTTTW